MQENRQTITKLTHLGDKEKLFPEEVRLIRNFYFTKLMCSDIDVMKRWKEEGLLIGEGEDGEGNNSEIS